MWKLQGKLKVNVKVLNLQVILFSLIWSTLQLVQVLQSVDGLVSFQSLLGEFGLFGAETVLKSFKNIF